jgi:hypothetical protein
MCILLVSSVKRSSSGVLTVHTASSFLCWYLSAAMSCKKLYILRLIFRYFYIVGCYLLCLCSWVYLYKINAAIWYNKTWREKHLESSYLNIKISGIYRQCKSTRRSAVKTSSLQDSTADRHQHRKLEAVCTVKGLLMMNAWRSKHVEYSYK